MAFNHANQTEGPIGTFSSVSDGQTINCPGVSANVYRYIESLLHVLIYSN